MNKAFHETLPRNYFDNIYEKIAHQLVRGQNVVISEMYGCGGKTLYNFIAGLIIKDKLFDSLYFYDPDLEEISLIDFTKEKSTQHPDKKKLILVWQFEKIANKNKVLETLDGMRRINPANLVFLSFTDYSLITNSRAYFAKTTVFFNERIYLAPFAPKATNEMIDLTTSFFGWKIPKKYYKKIYELSGGVPRLMKYVCKELAKKNLKIDDVEKFKTNASILFQLDYFVHIMLRVPKDQLITLGLIDKNGKIISKLLEEYLQTYESDIVKRLYPALSHSEAKVLSYLVENEGEIISIDKIGDLMNLSDEKYSLWAIYKLLSRLKPKVKNNFAISNIKGKGYLLNKST